MAKRSDAILRIGTEGGEVVIRDLKQIADAGKRSMAEVDAAMRRPGPGMLALNGGMDRLYNGAENVVRQIPLVGNELALLGGPALLATAGVAAIAAALSAAAGAGRSAAAEIAEVSRAAATLGASTDLYQAGQFAAASQGLGPNGLDQAFLGMQRRVSEARQGTGELVSKLNDLDPAFLVAIARAEDFDQRLELTAVRLQSARDETEELAIATALFGDKAPAVIRLLEASGYSLDAMKTAAREAGAVIGGELTAEMERLDAKLAAVEYAANVRWRIAMSNLAPVTELLADAHFRLGESIGFVVQAMQSREDQSGNYLEHRQREIQERIEALAAIDMPFGRGARAAQTAVLVDELADVTAQLHALASAESEVAEGGQASDEALAGLLGRLEEVRNDPAMEALSRRGEAVTAAMRTAAETLLMTQKELKVLNHAGAITAETFDRAMTAAQKTFEAAQASNKELPAAIDNTERLREAALAVGDSFARGLGRAITDIRTLADAAGLLNNILADVVATLAQVYITDPLVEAVGGALGGVFGGGSGGSGKIPKTIPKHHDGTPAVGPIAGELRPSWLGPDEHLRVLQRGEAVIPAGGGSDGGRRSLPTPIALTQKVVFEGFAKGEVEVRQRPPVDPTRELGDFVIMKVRAGISDGKFDNAMSQTYGLRHRAVR